MTDSAPLRAGVRVKQKAEPAESNIFRIAAPADECALCRTDKQRRLRNTRVIQAGLSCCPERSG
jgi:hypothetical protein